MKNKKTTLKDIAKILNITPSAVSKALNNHPRIGDKTKTAVHKVAKELSYQRNHLASALRKGRSDLVGVIIPRAGSNFFSLVVQGIEAVLSKNGYNVIICYSNESYEKECRNIDSLLQIQVDGIISSIANGTSDIDYYEKIKSSGIPLILFDRGDDRLKVDFVGIDDYKSSHEIVNHLIDQNCKKIAHLAGNRRTKIYYDRLKGYKNALKKNDIPINREYILEGDLTIKDGREKMEKLLKLPIPPDAIYAAGDYAALGALQVLQEKKIKVPEEIALVGFSNEPFTSLVKPTISTINQHSVKIGKLAAETLLKRMLNPDWKPSLNKIILESELLIRATSNRKK